MARDSTQPHGEVNGLYGGLGQPELKGWAKAGGQSAARVGRAAPEPGTQTPVNFAARFSIIWHKFFV